MQRWRAYGKEELNDTKAGMLRELNEEIGLTEFDLSDISLRYVTNPIIDERADKSESEGRIFCYESYSIRYVWCNSKANRR